MRLRSIAIALAALFVAGGLPPSAVGRARTTCVLPRDAALVRVSASVKLYRRPNADGSTYRLVACLRSTNRRRILDYHLGLDLSYVEIVRRPLAIRTAGRYFAMLVTYEEPRYDAYAIQLQVFDLIRGRTVGISVNDRAPDTVDGLMLSANGRVVFNVKSVSYRPSGVPEIGLWTLQQGQAVSLERGSGPFTDASFTKDGVRWTSPTGAHDAPVGPALR